jgi:hypothetical protein
MATRATPSSVRQPVSCEPCRKRKIKCSRTRPPCSTCQRRGCPTSCIYVGHPLTYGESSSSGVGNEELLVRISNLENMLKKQMGTKLPLECTTSNDMSMLSPPLEMAPSRSLDRYVCFYSIFLYRKIPSRTHSPASIGDGLWQLIYEFHAETVNRATEFPCSNGRLNSNLTDLQSLSSTR